jgi:hypothetical protein
MSTYEAECFISMLESQICMSTYEAECFISVSTSISRERERERNTIGTIVFYIHSNAITADVHTSLIFIPPT